MNLCLTEYFQSYEYFLNFKLYSDGKRTNFVYLLFVENSWNQNDQQKNCRKTKPFSLKFFPENFANHEPRGFRRILNDCRVLKNTPRIQHEHVLTKKLKFQIQVIMVIVIPQL